MKPASLALVLALCACASGTEGRIVHVYVAVQPQPEAGRALGAFDTTTGWSVQLDRAEIALAAVYAFAPVQDEPKATAGAPRWFVSVARAHGGHDPLSGKRVRAEWREPIVIDLLDEALRELGEVEAEAGSVETLAVDIAARDADITARLDGFQAWVAGEARRDGEQIRFEGGLTIPDDGLSRRIETGAGAIALDDGDTVVLGWRPSVWLRDAAFDRLEPAAGGAARAIVAGSQVHRAWYLGARSPAALSMRAARKGDER